MQDILPIKWPFYAGHMAGRGCFLCGVSGSHCPAATADPLFCLKAEAAAQAPAAAIGGMAAQDVKECVHAYASTCFNFLFCLIPSPEDDALHDESECDPGLGLEAIIVEFPISIHHNPPNFRSCAGVPCRDKCCACWSGSISYGLFISKTISACLRCFHLLAVQMVYNKPCRFWLRIMGNASRA